MFTCVKLKNFKSFNDITLDLTDKNNRPKSLVLIYGENGIGKSNLASAFYMLSETLRTMEFRDLMQEIFNNKPKNISDSELRSLFTSRFKDIETLINENKTVDSTENLYMDFRSASVRFRFPALHRGFFISATSVISASICPFPKAALTQGTTL